MVSVNLTLTTSFGPVERPKCLHSCMQYWSGYKVDRDPKTRYTPGAFVNKTARYSGMRGKTWVGAIALPWRVPQNALVSRRGAIVVNAEQGTFGSTWSRATGSALLNVRCSTMAPSPLPIKEVHREAMASILVYLCGRKALLLPYTAVSYYIICTWYCIYIPTRTNEPRMYELRFPYSKLRLDMSTLLTDAILLLFDHPRIAKIYFVVTKSAETQPYLGRPERTEKIGWGSTLLSALCIRDEEGGRKFINHRGT